MLLFRNVASGIGNDLERGFIQTILAYPLKRRWILTAKLISAFAVATVLFLGMQFSALCILAPDMVAPHWQVVLLTYATYLSLPLLVASLTLLLTLLLRKGGLAVIIGFMMFFLFSILSSLVSVLSQATNSFLPLQLCSPITPYIAMDFYYSSLQPTAHVFWTPSFSEVLSYIGVGYGITTLIFILSYIYFSRRLGA